MESPSPLVKVFLGAGIILIAAGLIIWLAGNKFSWLGKLPGDIRIEKENFKFYMPITTMILVSIILTLIIRFINKYF